MLLYGESCGNVSSNSWKNASLTLAPWLFFAVQRTAGDVGRGHLLLGKLNLKSIDFIATRDGVGGTSETLVTPAENAGCSTGSRTELWFVRSGTRVEGLR